MNKRRNMDLKIFTDNIDEASIDQIHRLMHQPAFAESKVRIMPDVHLGKGCVIGFTADLGDKVIPNVVGVDIGCGMLTIELGQVDIDLVELDRIIRARVPSGFNVHPGRSIKYKKLQDLYCYRELNNTKRIERSIGTLGGGNHFIEIDEDDAGTKYLVIHTGSRNLGKQVAEYYQRLAVELMQGKDELFEQQEKIIKEYKSTGRRKEISKAIKRLNRAFKPKKLDIPKDLCYLTGKYRDQYLHDMKICQEYAVKNRKQIAKIILGSMNLQAQDSFETIHNYIDHDSNIVRKGAVSAQKGEKLLIPINMRDGCIIAVGKGNPDWNYSAPHGAGRIMSRTQAKKRVRFSDYKKSMEGIYTTSVNKRTLDESPMVYKPLEEIVDNIKDTAEVIKIIRPIYNFKAD
ncbi:MAG: RtcB family protein [Clostridiaceae bacterium]|nr:RtcB family protein [Clostridiaceae bacterium]